MSKDQTTTEPDSAIFDAPIGSEVVLIVDDEPVVLRLVCTILSRQGYKVLGAAGPDEALRYCEHERQAPHLLLTDIVMPKLNGAALAERIAGANPNIRILFMSGFDGREIPEYETLLRGGKLISKPFTPRDLLLAVRSALDKPAGNVVS